MLKRLFDSPHTMTVDERKGVTRSAGKVAAFSVGFVVTLALLTASNVVPAENPWWDAILQARLVLVRLVLAVPLICIGYYLALVLYAAFSKTAVGRQIVIHEDGEGANMHGFKTSNSGFIVALLMLSCIGGLLLGVLK